MTADTEVTHEDVSPATPITARDAAADAEEDAVLTAAPQLLTGELGVHGGPPSRVDSGETYPLRFSMPHWPLSSGCRQ